jgi:hypothetical protein
MRTRTLFAASGVVAAVACALPDTRYGAPGDLSSPKLPGADTLVCGDAGELEGGIGDGGEIDGGGPGGGCAVSWRGDIYAKMTGEWGCAASACHAPDAAPPVIDSVDASAALTSLKAWQLSTRPSIPYVGAGGSIDCNLGGVCSPTMPIAPYPQLTQTERCTLRAWLACGAPDN